MALKSDRRALVVSARSLCQVAAGHSLLLALLFGSTATADDSLQNTDNYSPSSIENVQNWEWLVDENSNIAFGNHYNDSGFGQSHPWDFDSIKATINTDEHLGASASLLFPDRTQGVYVSYCIRFAENWRTLNSGGKLPGFAGNSSPSNGGQGGNPSNGYNAWSARMLFGASQDPEGDIPVGFYVYHSDQAAFSNFGDVDWWAEAPNRLFQDTVKLKRNRWYSIKQFIYMNDPWVNNGVLQAWLDNEKVYSRDDLNFTNSEEFREVYRFWLNVYHGGGMAAPQDMTVYIDQVSYSFGSDTTRSDCAVPQPEY